MKNRVYVIEEKENNKIFKWSFIEFLLGVIAYALILLIANSTFQNFYIESFIWAVVVALVVSLLNSTIKPILIWLTLPITISTLGILYPIVNMIILKIADLLLGHHFEVKGFWILFFIAIFISILRVLFDYLLIKPIMRGIKK